MREREGKKKNRGREKWGKTGEEGEEEEEGERKKKLNVIGVPITDETLKAMSRYRHKKNNTRR